jgi:large subunit ribosomal protein L29
LKASQLRELSDEELIVKIRDTRKELFNLRFQHATGQLDNPHKLAITRHEIGRLLTVQHQREIEREQAQAAAGGEA